jgi:RHS repeat-associated protein
MMGYTGKPYDPATGLYNYGYRDYHPEAARFTTVDPIRDGSNWFAYVNNDPVNWIDPLGLNPYDTRTDMPLPPGPGNPPENSNEQKNGVTVHTKLTLGETDINGFSDVNATINGTTGVAYGNVQVNGEKQNRVQINVNTSFTVHADFTAPKVSLSAPTVHEINGTINTKIGSFSGSYNFDTKNTGFGYSISF